MSTSSPKQEQQFDVIDHPAVALWMKDVMRKDPEGFLKLMGNNVDFFTRYFGKPTWRDPGEKGWTHGWSAYENSLQWLILTGKCGTIFRVRLPTSSEAYLADPKVGVGLVGFLSSLYKNINN